MKKEDGYVNFICSMSLVLKWRSVNVRDLFRAQLFDILSQKY